MLKLRWKAAEKKIARHQIVLQQRGQHVIPLFLMANEVTEILQELGLEQYSAVLGRAGFESWGAIRDIREKDLIRLNFRLGDRRKLQREIARRQLWPESRPLPMGSDMRRHNGAGSRNSVVLEYLGSGEGSRGYNSTRSGSTSSSSSS